MIFISHRGESCDAPENTLPAFALSFERGTSGMECDIHLTRDKVLVVIHDSDTCRVSGQSMIIEESTYEELRQLDVSCGKPGYTATRIPKFSEVLPHLGKDRLFYVEIKKDDPAVIDAMIRELAAAKIPPEQIVMISFHREMVRLSKQYMPEVKTLWLTGFKAEDGVFHLTAEECAEILTDLRADGIDAECREDAFGDAEAAYLKSRGFFVGVWTVDDAERAARYIRRGVDAVTSNCACRLRDILGS